MGFTLAYLRSLAKPAIVVLGWLTISVAHGQARINYAEWQLEWGEEFATAADTDTATLAKHWRFYYPWGRSQNSPLESNYNSAKELQPGPGMLLMTIHRLAQPITYRNRQLLYTAPMLFSQHPIDSLRPSSCAPANGFSYGLFEVRARLPTSANSSPGFWLFGGVPDEIDVFEGSAQEIGNNFHLAPGGYWRPTRQAELGRQCFFYNTDPVENLATEFHTYGMSWLPNEVVFYYDGLPIRRETELVPAGCAMSVIVNMAVAAWAQHNTDTMAVDYIRIYRPRHLPYVPPALPAGAQFPQTEQAWLPAEIQPGRLPQDTHQTWRLAPVPGHPGRLTLLLTDNYNPPGGLHLPLPRQGIWAPTWAQTYGTPELRVQTTGADSIHWVVRNALGQPLAAGTASGTGTWQARWAALEPGTYSLHLQQGTAALSHPLTIMGRPMAAPVGFIRKPAE